MPPRKAAQYAIASVALALATAVGPGDAAQEPSRYEITVTAKRHAFSPARIEVRENDVVKITLVTEDIPHSFTIDEYRISKRASPGRPVTFEFRADKAGAFAFYCNLTTEDGCRQMRGELVVTPRRP